MQMGRPVAVWTVVTTATAAAGTAVPGSWRTSTASPGTDAVAEVLVAVCTTGLALALAWLWVITTSTVLGVLAGRARAGGGTTRRLVLAACGAAVLAGTTSPALAIGGDGSELLAGLALPERAVAPPRAARAPAEPAAPVSATYVVRAGDSLWSIAAAHGPSTTPVDQRWREIWQANRDVVGDDPDLILPGQALRLPTHPPHSDGDR
jgi:LysM repeat protein